MSKKLTLEVDTTDVKRVTGSDVLKHYVTTSKRSPPPRSNQQSDSYTPTPPGRPTNHPKDPSTSVTTWPTTQHHTTRHTDVPRERLGGGQSDSPVPTHTPRTHQYTTRETSLSLHSVEIRSITWSPPTRRHGPRVVTPSRWKSDRQYYPYSRILDPLKCPKGVTLQTNKGIPYPMDYLSLQHQNQQGNPDPRPVDRITTTSEGILTWPYCHLGVSTSPNHRWLGVVFYVRSLPSSKFYRGTISSNPVPPTLRFHKGQDPVTSVYLRVIDRCDQRPGHSWPSGKISLLTRTDTSTTPFPKVEWKRGTLLQRDRDSTRTTPYGTPSPSYRVKGETPR